MQLWSAEDFLQLVRRQFCDVISIALLSSRVSKYSEKHVCHQDKISIYEYNQTMHNIV